MDIKQLETFVEVVSSKNFSKAAENLFLTQPTVSLHIKALENEFNTELIKRSTKDFEITADGEKLYSYALRVLSIKDKINEALLKTKKTLLKIGSSSAISVSDLPNIISNYHKEKSEIKFDILSSDSLDIIKKVNDGVLEIGFVGSKSNEYDLQFLPFTSDELMFILPNNDEYNQIINSKDPIKQILEKPFIMREDKSGTRAEMLKYFDKENITQQDLNIITWNSDPLSIIEFVKLGLGVSIMSSKILEMTKIDDKILTYPLNYNRNFYIASPKEKNMSLLSREFLEFLKKYFKIK